MFAGAGSNMHTLKIFSIVATVLLAIAFVSVESCSTHTYVGTLVGKDAPVSITHDERETEIETDEDGNMSIRTTGEDATTAHIVYNLTFDVEGKLREIPVERFSSKVMVKYADQLALNSLWSSHSPPPFYVHSKINREYVVKVCGWLGDWGVLDLTDMATMKAE